ncbi:MAG: suppressor of fused domain protein [Phormidesmis sp.]
MNALERVWEYREETVYPSLFGPASRGTFVLSFELFKEVFSTENIDPRWLHYGVIEYGPTQARDSWIYVTTATSNPWEAESDNYNKSEFSGFGTELVLEVPKQGDWAIVVLQRLLAFNILLGHGHFGTKPMLDYGDRIPLRSPITLTGESRLRNIVITLPKHYESRFTLESGQVDLLHLVGISDREVAYGQQQGNTALLKRLEEKGYSPVTLPDRNELDDISIRQNGD